MVLHRRARSRPARSELTKVAPSLDCRGRPSREILLQGGADLLQRPVDLIAGDDKRRGDADCVFMSVLGEDASALQALAVAARPAGFRVKLDRQHQAASAHLADGVGADASEAIEEARAQDSGV